VTLKGQTRDPNTLRAQYLENYLSYFKFGMQCSFVSGMPSGRTNNFPESGRGLGHVTPTIFGSTVGYPRDSLASCYYRYAIYTRIITQPDAGATIDLEYWIHIGFKQLK